MTEAEWALVQLLDGEEKHDLYSTDLSKEAVDRIWNAYLKAYLNVSSRSTLSQRDLFARIIYHKAMRDLQEDSSKDCWLTWENLPDASAAKKSAYATADAILELLRMS